VEYDLEENCHTSYGGMKLIKETGEAGQRY
jgi:hypothetical protein